MFAPFAVLEIRVTQIFLLFFRNSFSLLTEILIYRVRMRLTLGMANLVVACRP
jgi:hypothetical protein